MSAVVIGALAFTLAGLLMWKKKAGRTQSWLMLLAGVCATGLVWKLAHKAGDAVVTGIGHVSGVALGTATPLIALLIVGFILWHGMHPKHGQHRSYHPWLALILPVLAVAAGGVFATAIGSAHDAVNQTTPTVQQIVGG